MTQIFQLNVERDIWVYSWSVRLEDFWQFDISRYNGGSNWLFIYAYAAQKLTKLFIHIYWIRTDMSRYSQDIFKMMILYYWKSKNKQTFSSWHAINYSSVMNYKDFLFSSSRVLLLLRPTAMQNFFWHPPVFNVNCCRWLNKRRKSRCYYLGICGTPYKTISHCVIQSKVFQML